MEKKKVRITRRVSKQSDKSKKSPFADQSVPALIDKPYDVYAHGITTSLLQAWLDCPIRARLQTELWTPLAMSVPLMFGTIFHKVLEWIYNRFRKTGTAPNTGSILMRLERVVEEHRKERETKAQWTNKAAQALEFIHAQLKAILPWYVVFWKDDFAKKKFVKVEGKFAEWFCGIPFRGMMDGAFLLNGKPWLLETKTKSRIDEASLLATLTLDLQINVYIYFLERILKKKPEGVLYNVVRRPGLKHLDSETLPQHTMRLAEDIKKRPEYYFMRFEVLLDWHHIQHFQNELTGMVSRYLDWARSRMPGWRFGNPCETKYGLCKFVPICHDDNYQPFFKRQAVFEELE